MTRKEFNLKIFKHLSERKFFENFFDGETCDEIYETLADCIQDFPDQRFGQIMTNYIYPDYRQRTEHSLNQIMDVLFYGIDMDPFYEESEDTFNRLV